MKKTILSALMLMGIVAATNAQSKTQFQVRAGVNFTNMNGDAEGDIKTGFHAGVEAGIPIADGFFIQPGIVFNQKGAAAKGDSDGKLTLNYIDVPVSLVYKPVLGSGHLILGFGPYVGFGIGGKYKNGSLDSKVEFGKDEAYKTTEFGGNIFAGYQLSNNLLLQLNTQLGMTDITNGEGSVKNTGFGLSLGYAF